MSGAIFLVVRPGKVQVGKEIIDAYKCCKFCVSIIGRLEGASEFEIFDYHWLMPLNAKATKIKCQIRTETLTKDHRIVYI